MNKEHNSAPVEWEGSLAQLFHLHFGPISDANGKRIKERELTSFFSRFQPASATSQQSPIQETAEKSDEEIEQIALTQWEANRPPFTQSRFRDYCHGFTAAYRATSSQVSPSLKWALDFYKWTHKEGLDRYPDDLWRYESDMQQASFMEIGETFSNGSTEPPAYSDEEVLAKYAASLSSSPLPYTGEAAQKDGIYETVAYSFLIKALREVLLSATLEGAQKQAQWAMNKVEAVADIMHQAEDMDAQSPISEEEIERILQAHMAGFKGTLTYERARKAIRAALQSLSPSPVAEEQIINDDPKHSARVEAEKIYKVSPDNKEGGEK